MMINGPEQSFFAVLAKYVGGKVLTAILVVAAGLAGYWFYRHPEQIQNLWNIIKSSLIWLGFVTTMPWALFFLPAKVTRAGNNWPAVGLLVSYLLIDIVFALWLGNWQIRGTLTLGVMFVGFLLAGVYNFLVCEYLADRSENEI